MGLYGEPAQVPLPAVHTARQWMGAKRKRCAETVLAVQSAIEDRLEQLSTGEHLRSDDGAQSNKVLLGLGKRFLEGVEGALRADNMGIPRKPMTGAELACLRHLRATESQ